MMIANQKINSFVWPCYKVLLCLSTLFVAMISSSCTVPLECRLYNNTNDQIKVIQIDISGNENIFYADSGLTLKLKGWALNDYKIVSKNNIWLYDPSIPNYDYVDMVGFGPWSKPMVLAQIEENGQIYLLSKDQKPPLNDFAKQPEGYPLIPTVKEK